MAKTSTSAQGVKRVPHGVEDERHASNASERTGNDRQPQPRGFAAYAASHFGGMFTERSDRNFRERIIVRAMRLDPVFGRALYLEAVTWDSARGKETLRQITVPLLLIQSTHIGSDLKRHPMHQGMTTVFMALVTELVPTSATKIIAGVGHFTMNEASDEVNAALLEFMMRVVHGGYAG